MGNSELEIKGASVSFGDIEALSNISLSFEHGSIAAIVGPSGAGKTTFLRLCGFAKFPTLGTVTLNGKQSDSLPIKELRDVRQSIGFVHQSFDVVPNIRVYQNVLLGRLHEFGLLKTFSNFIYPSKSILLEIHEILERLGIKDKMYERTDHLSGGQLQRVAIARALFQHPLILIADEPVSSVDPARARATIKLLVELAKEFNKTLLVSLHNFDLAAEFFPRLIGFQQGRTLFDSETAEITQEQQDKLYALSDDQLQS